MNIYIIIFIVLCLFYLDYRLCDILPGKIPNGKRQIFCNYPIITTAVIVLYLYFLYKNKK